MKEKYPIQKKTKDEFERIAREMIKFLNDNFHPHMTVVISTTSAELTEGVIGFTTDDYIID